jgi:hypothetical protein
MTTKNNQTAQDETMQKVQHRATLEISAGFVHTSEALALQLYEARLDNEVDRDEYNGVTLDHYVSWVSAVNK